MSVILITKHDENIYNVATTEQEEKMQRELNAIRTRAIAYESRFKKYRDFYAKKPKAHATMGVPENKLPDPAAFLRKGTGKPLQKGGCRMVDKVPKKEPEIPKVLKGPTPTFEECKKRVITHTPKNFVKDNIKEISQMKPKEPEEKVVEDRLGNSRRVKGVLEPVYIKAKNFGKAPRYLLDIINNNKMKYIMLKDETGFQKQKCKYICREERSQLLEGLKQNWEELQKQYQVLPILTDTIPKIIRKAKIEANLKQLEKDIQLIERHPYIYVYDDDNFP